MKKLLIFLLTCLSMSAIAQKISDLPAASTLGGTEVVAGVQGTTTKKISINHIGTFMGTLYSPIISPTFTGLVTTPLIKITSGSPGAGKFLTSDADGDASWTIFTGINIGNTNLTLTGNRALAGATHNFNIDNVNVLSFTSIGAFAATTSGDYAVTAGDDYNLSVTDDFAINGSAGTTGQVIGNVNGTPQWEDPSASSGGSFNHLTPSIKTASYTATAADTITHLYMRHVSTPMTVTLPAAATVPVGRYVVVTKDTTAAVTFVGAAGEDIIGTATLTADKETAVWHHRETGKWVRVGGGTSGGGSGVSDGDYGDITVSSSNTVWTIDNLAVTNAKINDVAVGKITGTLPTGNGGTGLSSWTQGDIPYYVSGTALSKLAKDANATRYLSNQGTSNAPSWNQVNLANGVTGNLPVTNLNSGTSASSSTFWRGDGTWATPGGGGTVTSVAATVPTFLSISGSPVTSSGTLAISLSGTALPVANGGTGITSFGTGVPTALGANVNGSGAIALTTSPTFVTPTLGVAQTTDDAYASGWDGSNRVPTQNAIYDKIQALAFVKAWTVAVTDEVSLIVTGNAQVQFRMPYAMTLTEVRASLNVAQASGTTLQINVKENGTTIFSTNLTIDNTETTTVTAAVPAVISDASLADDSIITVDVVAVDAATSAVGLKVTLKGS